MDSSRKYDKFRELPYLILAIGYFLLVIWSLLRATFITSDLLAATLSYLQLAGFVAITIGYLTEQYHESPSDQAITKSVEQPAPTPSSQSTQAKELPKWVAMLSNDDEPTALSASTVANPITTATNAPAESPTATQNATESLTVEPVTVSQKPAKMKAISHEKPIDLSYLAKRTKAKIEPKTMEPTESREEILDELFPVTPKPAVTPKTAKVRSKTLATQKKAAAAPTKTKKPAKKAHGVIALSFATLDSNYLLTHWVESLPLLLLFIIVLQTARHPKHHGNLLLAIGFTILLIIRLFADNSLLLLGLEALGYGCIGLASWIRIKGKVTHHFLTVMSFIYLIVLALITALATVIVTDQTSLQLLLLLCTGTLIALLPIVHSLTYSHPAQTVYTEEPHDS